MVKKPIKKKKMKPVKLWAVVSVNGECYNVGPRKYCQAWRGRHDRVVRVSVREI